MLTTLNYTLNRETEVKALLEKDSSTLKPSRLTRKEQIALAHEEEERSKVTSGRVEPISRSQLNQLTSANSTQSRMKP